MDVCATHHGDKDDVSDGYAVGWPVDSEDNGGGGDLFDLSKYGYLLLGCALGVGSIGVVAYLLRRKDSAHEAGADVMGWLLFGPFFKWIADDRNRVGKFLTKREIVGWGIFSVIALLGVVFF